MTTAIQINESQSKELRAFHEDLDRKVKLTGCCVIAASFLIIGALIVIGCSCLCLTLPGINAINDVILPAVVPSLLAIIVSIPFILLSVQYNRDKNYIREPMIERMINLLDEYGIPEQSRKVRVKFILNNFLKEHWAKNYRSEILTDIKKRLGKEKEDRNSR